MRAYEVYFDTLEGMLKRAFSEQEDVLEAAAEKIADSLMGGGMLYTFGTGHAHLLAEEIFYRAGGLVRVCPMLDERLMLHVSASRSSQWERTAGLGEELMEKYPAGAGDVVLLISNSGRNTVPVEVARLARERGAVTIALTSLAHSGRVTPRNPWGQRLFEVCDLVLDNMGVPGDACVPLPDGRFVSPTSTAVGSALLQAMAARVEEIAREKGNPVETFISSNVDGGDEWNERLIEKYRDRIPGL